MTVYGLFTLPQKDNGISGQVMRRPEKNLPGHSKLVPSARKSDLKAS